MAIQTQPSRIPQPFAGSGTKNVIPSTNSTPTASQAASWASGFPPECSQPISAGGCPVPRNDMNGALNQLSQDYAFRQDGGVWEWSASADYDLQRIVRGSDGLLYCSVAQSGPGVAAGAHDPTLDASHAYWSSPMVPTMPAGDSSSAAASTGWVNAWRSSLILPSIIYIDPVNGSDSNTGYSSSAALKTIAAAEAKIASPNFISPSAVTVQLASGTYGETISGVPGVQVSYSCRGSGNEASVLSVSTVQGANINLGGNFRCGSWGISRGATVRITNGTSIVFDKNLVSGESPYAIYVYIGGVLSTFVDSSSAISFENGFTATRATLVVAYNATVAFFGQVTWSGSVTGKRYELLASASLSGVGGENVIPGTAAGTVDSTSYFA